jgi:hypothetical protein
MTTLGKTTTGTTTNTSSGNKAVVSPATASGSGTLTAGHFRVSISAGTADVNLVVYADSGGSPGALLAVSDTLTISNTALAWNDFTFSGANQISISNGVTYHVGGSWADPGATSFTYERDNTASQRFEQTSHNPDPFGTPSLNSGGPVAAYVEFSAGASATPGAATGTGSAGAPTADVAYVAPGSAFDLTNWYLTLPTDDGSGGAATVTQPTLDTYADANFYLDASGRMVDTAPVNGFTTGGSSATRTELREQEGGVNASWDIATAQRVLTISGFYDSTSITGGTAPKQVQIIGQIHATGGTPPVYVTVDYDASPSRMRVFIDADGGVGDLCTGFAPSDQLALRIEVTGGNVNLYGCIGTETDLPSSPQFTYAAAHFVESTGCYLKAAGAYNKTDTGTGASGESVATITYLQLLQNTVAANAGVATGTGAALAPTADSSNRSASAGVASGTGSALVAAAGTETNIGTSILRNVTSGVRLALEVAWGADLTDLDGSGWTWTDITADVQLSQGYGIDLQVGAQDEASQTQPSQLTAVLDNSEGSYSLGPQSPNYPNVVRNVPVRLRISTDSGATWTVQYQGNAVGFTPNWDTSGQWATVTLTASGWLRQLNQGTLPVTSCMRRYMTSGADTTLSSYWPFEEPETSTVNLAEFSDMADPTWIWRWCLNNSVVYTGNSSKTVFNAQDSSFASSAANPRIPAQENSGTNNANFSWVEIGQDPATKVAAPSTIRQVSGSYVGGISAGAGDVLFAFEQNFYLDLIGTGGANTVMVVYQMDASGTASPNNGALTFQVWEDVRSAVYIMPPTTSGFKNLAGIPFRWRLTWSVSGGNTAWTIGILKLGDTTETTFTHTTTGFAFAPEDYGWQQVGAYIDVVNNGYTGGGGFGHIAYHDASSSLTAYADSFNAFTGESVTDRMTRLANDETIPLTVLTDSATETSTNTADTLGPQYVDSLSNLLRECETTGIGRLYDGLNIGLTYVTRLLRESQQPLLTLDVSSGVVVMPFAPVHDDQNIVNQMTVTRRNGSSVTATDDTSVAAIGIHANSATVNPETDTGLDAAAEWFVHVGTPPTGVYRYPSWAFALEKDPSLIADWLACFPSCRVDVTNIDAARSQHPSGTIRNVLEGWHERISQHRWVVEANTSSYEPWRVITLAAATGSTSDTVGRYEPDSDTASTVATSASAGATSLSVAFTGTRWVTTADTGGSDNFPLTVEINGWPVTVSNITGTTSPQTFTVSALTHPVNAGDAITIYQNAVLGM